MEVAGYIASLLIGISLGLIGGGGSIITVPVLVYLFRVQPVLATAYSLFIVGSTSLIGTVRKYHGGEVNIKTAITFGVPSIVAVFVTRKLVIPAIPDELLTIGGFVVTKSLMMMIVFAMLMVFASITMISNRKKHVNHEYEHRTYNAPLMMLEGVAVGALTGLVGAGGGFLIIPALVLLGKLPMKEAVGTSLLIIAANSLIGFAGDTGKSDMNWTLLLTITGLAILGIFIGNLISKKISSLHLKKGFGWFVLAVGLYIIFRELAFPGSVAH